MPTTYAHYRFGQEILNQLPQEIKNEIKSYQTLFDIGLHGPDIFFYYKPYKKTTLSRFGSAVHVQQGYEVFEKLRQQLKAEETDTVALRVYIIGFLCHYALDKNAHPFIYDFEETGLSHSEIEAEFDAMLMKQDGYNPIRYKVTGHLKHDGIEPKIITKAFPQFSEQEIKEALDTMVLLLDAFVTPSILKHLLVKAGFLVAGKYKQMNKLVINRKSNPICHYSNQKIYACFKHGIEEGTQMVIDFYNQLEKEHMEFSTSYNHTFERD